MKKIFLGLLALCAFTACSDDDGGSASSVSYGSIAGTWYEEAENEEVTYTDGGRFYDFYCNQLVSGYKEGTYDLNGNKLTTNYNTLGQKYGKVWTVSDVTEYTFSITSQDVGKHTYCKVMETVSVEPDNSAWSRYVQSDKNVVSLDERIVQVESNGRIVSQGMKGSTYIRVTDGGNTYYVKVMVDVDARFYDLWYDYTRLFGADENDLRLSLGAPSATNQQGELIYLNMQGFSDYVASVLFSLENGKTDLINVFLIEGTSVNSVHTYLNTRFYYVGMTQTTSGPLYLYRSHPTDERSAFIVGYYSSIGQVVYQTLKEEELWPDFTQGLGKTHAEVLAQYGENPYLNEDERIVYLLDNEYIKMSYFSFDDAKEKVLAVSLIVRDEVEVSTVVDWMNSQYTVFENGTAEDGSQYAWINAATLQKATAGITYDVANKMITYVDLTARRSQVGARSFETMADVSAVRGISSMSGIAPFSKQGTVLTRFRSLK